MPYLKEDKRSHVNRNRVYGKAGQEIEIIRDDESEIILARVPGNSQGFAVRRSIVEFGDANVCEATELHGGYSEVDTGNSENIRGAEDIDKGGCKKHEAKLPAPVRQPAPRNSDNTQMTLF